MSENIITKDVTPGLNAFELIGGMMLKPASEKGLTPVVGNGTLKSGLVKIGLAYVAGKYVRKHVNPMVGNVGAVALGVDGAEDLGIVAMKALKLRPAEATGEGAF